MSFPFFHDGIHCRVAQSLDGSQSKTDISVHVHTELPAADVDIRPQSIDTDTFTLAHQLRNVGNVRQASAHYGCHVLGREISFQVSRLVSHPRIARGMALVERIRGKLLPVRPNLFQHFRVVAILLSALDELGIHVVQLFYQLLTHSLTQCIALASRKIGQLAGQQHHLLLIHRDTVCVFQILLHTRYVVFHRFTPLFTVDKVGYIIHRPRTVKRIHGDKVLECGRLQFAQILLHAGRFELERPYGTPVTIQAIGGRIRNVQCIHVDVKA